MSAIQRSEMKIAVIGLGHVGLPTALGLAELGWEVTGADDDEQKLQQIAAGRPPFYEPGMEQLLRRHLETGRFRVARPAASVARSEVVFVCVGTPRRDDGSADLSHVEAVARCIAENLDGYKLIVEKSTTPVQTALQIKRTIMRYRGGNHEFDVAVNPEFLREGTAIRDFFSPDRIVLGVESERSQTLLLQLYKPLLDRLSDSPSPLPTERVVITDLNTAEIIKHASNAFLAMKISFINMIADICEGTGADVAQVAHGLGLDPRIGPAFLQAGVGFGGYCLPKDLRAFIRIGEEQGVDISLLRAVEEINRARIDRIVQKVRKAVWVLRGKSIAILGVAFKPMTDDVREAPSLKIARRLLDEGADVRFHDPQAMANIREVLPEDPPRVTYCATAYEASRGAHALLIGTKWEEYRTLDLAKIRSLMEVPVLIDGRNMFEPTAVRALGFEYFAVGRP